MPVAAAAVGDRASDGRDAMGGESGCLPSSEPYTARSPGKLTHGLIVKQPAAIRSAGHDRRVDEISFVVLGKPQPAGSKKWLPRKGQAGARPIITDANRNLKPWMQTVAWQAKAAMKGRALLTEAVELQIRFLMPRPRNHYRTGRFAELLRDDAPPYHVTQPDTTKLLRGTEDALRGIVWNDDAQVVLQIAEKHFADDGQPRAEIRVKAMPPAGVEPAHAV